MKHFLKRADTVVGWAVQSRDGVHLRHCAPGRVAVWQTEDEARRAAACWAISKREGWTWNPVRVRLRVELLEDSEPAGSGATTNVQG